MRPSELLDALHQANKRLQTRIDWLEQKRLREISFTAATFAQLCLLNKDVEHDAE